MKSDGNFVLCGSSYLPYLQQTGTTLLMVGLFAWCNPKSVDGQHSTFERPPIDYHGGDVNDPVAQLARSIAAGEKELVDDEKFGYLNSLLKLLDIPVESQALVFSKTSLQIQKINPARPRAIYFNDDVYVGYCHSGDIIELAATDPQQGAIFYSLKQNAPPEFIRDRGQCLICHANTRTQNVPGYLVRSTFPNRAGHPILGSGTFTTDHTSPFDERWGGWYVTGQHGDLTHLGNQVFVEGTPPDLQKHANRDDLEGLVATHNYPSQHSDIVALMVLEHQTQMHNAITYANFETREALDQSYRMNELLEREPGTISDIAQRRISAAADRVLEYLLFCNEFNLTSPISGTSGFQETFAAKGIRDSQGRSLRDFNLQTRMFEYPCSYLIYSAAFDGLPCEVRTLVVERLQGVLQGRDDSEKFAHVTPESRQAIWEILKATKPDLFADLSPLD